MWRACEVRALRTQAFAHALVFWETGSRGGCVRGCRVCLSVCVVTTEPKSQSSAAAVYKQSYFSQTFYAYPPREGSGGGRTTAQEMCQLYGSLGRVSQSVSQSAASSRERRRHTRRKGVTSRRKILWGNFKKAGETGDMESESKWIGEPSYCAPRNV